MSILATGTTNTVIDSMVSGIQSIASDAMSGIGSIIPVALPIMGAIVVVGIGIKVFKKVTK